jgi:multidrug efflux pump
MLGLINGALSRTRTVMMILVLLLISGWATYQSIPKEANPDITIPIIYVSIAHDGISPQDAERMLVRPMENELRSIEGIKEMKSTASEGHASVTLEFIAGLDPKEALADVRDRVTLAKAKLPAETEEPTINEVTMANQNPVLTVILSGPVTERGLVTLARDLQDKLEGLQHILEVKIGGDREDVLEVIVDPMLLESYGLDQGDILNLLSRNNTLVTAGTMDNGKGRFAVKVPSVFESLEDIYKLPVKVDGDRVITFADVANVRRSYKDPSSFARLDGKRSVSLEMVKRPGENIIETVDLVKSIVTKDQQRWPEQIVVTYTGDQSDQVRDMLRDLQNNVASAVLLVVIVIIAALGARTAALVGIAIPGSFLTGILVLAIFGLTVNIVVLFALIMAVGMLVDGAIVVTEFADRKMSEGTPRQNAYKIAATRMAWPIIASTATTLAAFTPLIFWPGIMGEFMKFLPITLIATLTASLLMALIFVPSVGTMLGKARPLSQAQSQQMHHAENGDLNKLTGFTGKYVNVLSTAVKHPWKVLASAFATATLVFVGYGMSGLGAEFFPTIEPKGVNITVRSHGDLSIIEQDNIMKSVEARLVDMPEVETLYSRTGGSGIIGTMRVNLVDWQRRRKADVIVKDIHANTATLAGVEVEVRKDDSGPSGGKALVLELNSRFPDKLEDAVRKVRGALEANEHFVNITDSSPRPGIEWELTVDRANAARFGADATLVGSTVRMVTNGLKVGEYRPDDVDDELDILIRFPEDKRDISRLDELRLKTSVGMVPISNLVKRTPVQKVDSISRVDSRRVLTVSADMAPGSQLGKVLPQLQEQLPGLGIDPSVNFTVKGENEDQAESETFLKNAFFVALFVMAIILVTQFNSFYQAGLILSAVIFSTVGVFLGLLIVQKPFGIVMSGIGVISLAGIVVNNNIVLIDTYNVLRKEGMEAVEAIIRTGAQRLRPVMLTTITTILGLMPMVMEMNIDFVAQSIEFGGPSTQWWSQLATAVAGGLAFSALLTLVLTPCLLALGFRISSKYKLHGGFFTRKPIVLAEEA